MIREPLAPREDRIAFRRRRALPASFAGGAHCRVEFVAERRRQGAFIAGAGADAVDGAVGAGRAAVDRPGERARLAFERGKLRAR
ncbi:hypothetical protein NX02_24115 [Sphingomonas sanxanigenens DSM 19645 = NX02]|uniref:Uncharacterized protein n=1 Tax=Sphingomonas sanxanigenens DSM 19645 = NX02 TaxID=1123269 RepID=W0AH34_9SPHN|nr:hypothetical protein NX02_24115 [Sphingomonas sanxanigenens DSM 19645 = NX02]